MRLTSNEFLVSLQQVVEQRKGGLNAHIRPTYPPQTPRPTTQPSISLSVCVCVCVLVLHHAAKTNMNKYWLCVFSIQQPPVNYSAWPGQNGIRKPKTYPILTGKSPEARFRLCYLLLLHHWSPVPPWNNGPIITINMPNARKHFAHAIPKTDERICTHTDTHMIAYG